MSSPVYQRERVQLRTCFRCGREFTPLKEGARNVCFQCKAPRKTEDLRNRRGVRPGDPLTNRERQIIEHLCMAEANKEIAAQLHLAEGSVKCYVTNILRKLRLPNRTAVAMAAQAGKI